MKNFGKNLISTVIISLSFAIIGPISAFAVTTPNLGAATTYGILGGTYTNTTVGGTTITNGDVGYTTPPAAVPTMVGGTIYGNVPPTPAARTDATAALTTLNAMTCPPANNLGTTVDLSLVHSASYTPGVYCSTGAMSIGTAGITLNGAGTYVFRADGTFGTVVDSVVTLAGGASACDVFWTPTGATTLAANTTPATTFYGTIIDNNNFITVGINVGWLGRALSLLAGTVTTDTDSITVPSGCTSDVTPPVITLVGTSPITKEFGSTYTDVGATAADNIDGNITANIVTVNPVNTSILGAYTVTYNVSDLAGNPATQVTRTVNVIDTAIPVITRLGLNPVSIVIGTVYTDAGATAADNVDGNITPSIITVNPVNKDVVGTYTVTYNVTDSSGNHAAQVIRTVKVIAAIDNVPPVITVVGSSTVSLTASTAYTDAGATALDDVDGDITTNIVTVNPVNINLIGTYTITYDVVDSSGNHAIQKIRTVNVVGVAHKRPTSTTAPIVPIIGILKVPSPLNLPQGAGKVLYNYSVWNVAKLQQLIDVTVVDDKCNPVVLVSGDANNNGKLDIDETWKYTCTSTLANTTTNTAIATAHSSDGYYNTAIATAITTVVVGAPIQPPLIHVIKVPSQLTPFPFGGGEVTYTYTITNPGLVSLNNVVVTDDKCPTVSYVSGDANNNNLLDVGESWIYACKQNIKVSTGNVATATGKANGLTAVAYAFVNVLVSSPSLPDTGLIPELNNTSWIIATLAGVIIILSISLTVVLKKKKV